MDEVYATYITGSDGGWWHLYGGNNCWRANQ